MTVRIKNLQSAKSLVDEKFDQMEFVVDVPDPDATLKLSGADLKEAVGGQQHTHPIEDVDGLPGELEKKFDKTGGIIRGNVDVRGNMRVESLRVDEYLEVPELKYNRISATGNEFWVTDGGIVDDVWEDNEGVFLVTLKSKEGETTINFQFKDILRGIYYVENADGTQGGFVNAYFEVTGVIDETHFDCISLNGIAPRRFMHLVRQGNKTNPRRQGSVYFDGLDKSIKVIDGVTDDRIRQENIKIQFGDLNGVKHPVFGDLEGYSGYMENVFICGRLIQRDPVSGKDWAVGSVAVNGEQVFHYDEDGKVTPNSITLSVTEHGMTSAAGDRKWEYKDGAGWHPIKGETGLSLVLKPDAAFWNNRTTLTLRFVVSDMYEDTITITKIRNGTVGKDGTDGTDGKTQYLHVRYSNNGGVSFTGNNGKVAGSWIGQYTDFDPVASLKPSDYTWAQIKGEKGADGINGTNGVDGSSQYFHVRYSAVADGNPMTTTPSTYIGTVVTGSPTAPTNSSAYKWARFQGMQGENGIPGTNGENGKTSYLHIKYSNNGGSSFTANNGETPGDWIGQYVDFVEADSNDPKKYTWTKIKGADGHNGINGTNGVDGSSQYFHVKYSSNPTGNPMSNNPDTYIGTVVTSNKTAPTSYSSYTWTRFKGAQGEQGDKGIPGTNGADGRTSYLHIKYSNNGGTSFTANNGETPGDWIGQYVDFVEADSNDPKKYTWTKIKGDQGLPGINGTNGINGTSQYFHVRYSQNSNGNPMTTTPNIYIGTAVTSSSTAPTGYASYKWARLQGMQGEKGIPGTNGSDGRTSYLHIKYSDNGGASFTANNGETPGDWIGQYVDFVEADSNDPKKYKWTKIKGQAGEILYLRGTGWNRTANAQVNVNGTFLFNGGGRGHHLLVLKRSSLDRIFYSRYDTYGSDAEINNLANKIQEYDDTHFIALVSFDAIAFNQKLVDCLVQYGSQGTVIQSHGRYPYAFLGYKGLKKGLALEYQSGTGANDPHAEIATNIISGQFVGIGTEGPKGIDGTSQYLHVRYSAHPDGNPMSTTPNIYIGTAVTSTSTAPTSHTSYIWTRLQGEIGESFAGRMIFRDPEFRQGQNKFGAYRNGILERITRPVDCPTTSTHCMEITNGNDISLTECGGYYQAVTSRPNAVFIQKVIAKLPTGYYLSLHRNSIGTGGTEVWLTPNAGTGKYETYLRKTVCGSDGTFSSFGHLRANRLAATPAVANFKWQIAFSTVYDLSDTEKYDDAIDDAKKAAEEAAQLARNGKMLVYRGTFSSATKYYNTKFRRDCVKYGSLHYVYKGENEKAGGWNAANWENFGAEFTSVATDLLLAQLAYIENLGVKNLRTKPSGERLEITEANNSLAFYRAGTTIPVVEIKTSTDSFYMGQGSGILVKQPQANISINNAYLHRGSEGSGVSMPVIPIGQPDTITQVGIYQSYTNKSTGKYKTALYIAASGTQGTATNADKIIGAFISEGGIFVAGNYSKLRCNNVLSGVTCAGMVSLTGSLLRSWVNSFMGGYLTSSRLGEGKYRITFSNKTYLGGASDYAVFILPDGPHKDGKTGAYGCTLSRTREYFEVWTADNNKSNDCAFTFIVFLLNKFW